MEREILSKVFDLVSPAVTRPGASWKDTIDAVVPVGEVLATAGITPREPDRGTTEFKREAADLAIAALVESVVYFTATEPKIRRLPGENIRVVAKGYYLGPAGDH